MRHWLLPPLAHFPRSAWLLISILVVTIGLALLGFVRVLPTLVRVPTQIDFAAYYVAGRMLNAGVPLYRPSPLDDAALGIVGVQHTGYIYPPFFAALLRPLAVLPYHLAETVWFLANVLLFIALCLLLCRLLALTKQWVIGLVLLGILLPAVYDTWLLGQVTILLTLLIISSVTAAVHPSHRLRNELLAGMLLGLAAAIKVYPIILAGVYALHRRWVALLGVFLSLAGTVLLGVAFAGGWETTRYWFTSVAPAASSMVPFPSNQSLRGVVARFLTATTFKVPVLDKDNYVNVTLTPLFNNQIISTIVVGVGSIIVVGVTMWLLLQEQKQIRISLLPLDFAIGTTVMLLITPVVWDFYYVHLLLPLVLLGSACRTQIHLNVPFAVVCLLLVLQRYWRFMLLYAQTPWLMISGFLAVMLLWVTLLILRRRQVSKE